MKKKIDPTLFDLCLGIVLYGVVFEIILLCISRKPSYSIGLWIGVILAVAGSVHMWWSLNRSLDMASKDAGKTVGTNNLVRYFVIVLVILALIYTDFANPIFAFCGYMGMKVSAYLNPVIRRISEKVFKI
ncbi:MAG: ATP synthase subunit I [Lachnospiraceae bacterium]|nr:ATP synthase subunit I [Lachnospiraceae bacterium]